MELAVSGGSLRALHRSIAFLSRVGPEVLIDARARDETLTLKSVNAARSAFARVAARETERSRRRVVGVDRALRRVARARREDRGPGSRVQ